MRLLLMALCAGLGVCGAAVGQSGEGPGTAPGITPGSTPGAQPPGRTPEAVFPQSDHELLRGPGADRLERLTLVDRDAQGRLVRLDASAEEAAIGLLRGRLDEAARARVDGLLVERSGAWDAFFRAHVREIVQLQSELAAGPEGRASAMGTIRALAADAPTREEMGVIRESLRAALGEGERAEFDRLLSEYRDALLAEVRAEAERRGVGFGEALREEMLKAFGGEIRRAYERETTLGRERLEEALEAMALSAQQEARVRNAITTYGQRRLLGEATAADRRALVAALAEALEPQQLRRFLELTRGG